jgi:alpha-beta hydrolase superfamily lysophospholipase
MRLDLETQLRDIGQFLAALRRAHEGRPLFLMGESMGSLLSTAYAAQDALPRGGEIDGVLLSVPVVGLRREVPGFLKRTLAFLARHFPEARLSPSRFVNGKTTAPPLTRDTAYQESLREKPHHLRGFSLGFLAELGELIDTSHRHAERLRSPALVLAAGNDCFVKPEQISSWFERIPATDKTHHFYPEAYHLLWHDWDRETVMADIEEWLEGRCEV